MAKRETSITFYCTLNEKKHIENLAKEAGLSRSAFCVERLTDDFESDAENKPLPAGNYGKPAHKDESDD